MSLRWLEWKECRKFIRSLKFKNPDEFREWAVTPERPYNIPSTPNREYREDWEGWTDFLGTKLTYEESKKAIKHLNIKNCSEYFSRVSELPRGVPRQAARTFKYRGSWVSWKDYLSL